MFRLFDHLRGVDVVRKDTQASLSEKLFRLNKKFLKHVLKLLRIMFPEFLCTSTLLFILLLVIVVSLELLIYRVGLLSGKFYKVLSEKDLTGFRDLAILSVVMIIGNALLKSLSDFVSALLRIVWRKYLTVYLNENYFMSKNFYNLQIQTRRIYTGEEEATTQQEVRAQSLAVSPTAATTLQLPVYSNERGNDIALLGSRRSGNFVSLDNPDQRITQDVDMMCASIAKIVPIILISPFIIGYYTYQAFEKAGYTGPLAVFIYFVIGGIFNGPLMSPIAGVVYLQDKLEGNFRYKHMSIRTHAESVAFYDSGYNELLQTNKLFSDLISISYRRTWKEFLLKLCVNVLQYLGGILSYLILAIPIFTHVYDNLKPGELSQLISNYSFICSYLVYLFTRLYDLSNEISIIAGNSHRVGQLIDAITNKSNSNPPNHTNLAAIQSQLNVNSQSANNLGLCLIAENLCVMTPDKRKLLIKNLNFRFEEHINILITGRSGCGKTSLFRVFNGLWTSYTGNLYLAYSEFKSSNIFFLPQTPYFTNGSLLEQIIYPTTLNELHDDDLIVKCKEWIKKFSLEHILDKVNDNFKSQPNFHWPAVLSLGEQQRLSFLRVLFHHPKYALLDEFTSSVDQETESLMYESLNEIHITYLSIAHRDTVRRYHDYELKILIDGDYVIKPIVNDESTMF